MFATKRGLLIKNDNSTSVDHLLKINQKKYH